MQSGVVELARQAAAAVRAERAARWRRQPGAAAMLPAGRKYRGVQKRRRKFVAILWNPYVKQSLWLGSYETPEEAAYAYDAAARRVLGRWAKPNFPEPAAGAVAGQCVGAAAARAAAVTAAEVLTDLALGRRAQVPAPARSFRQPAVPRPQAAAPPRRWAPAPATASQRRQRALPALPYQRAPPAFPYQRAVIPISQLLYRRGPAAAGASHGAGFFALPLLPGAYVGPELNRPVSSDISSTEAVDASQPRSAERRELPTSPATAIGPDQSVVGDNFTDDGASSSAASNVP